MSNLQRVSIAVCLTVVSITVCLTIVPGNDQPASIPPSVKANIEENVRNLIRDSHNQNTEFNEINAGVLNTNVWKLSTLLEGLQPESINEQTWNNCIATYNIDPEKTLVVLPEVIYDQSASLNFFIGTKSSSAKFVATQRLSAIYDDDQIIITGDLIDLPNRSAYVFDISKFQPASSFPYGQSLEKGAVPYNPD